MMMRLWASFLNNSSSRWEPIWENWPLHLELMDIVSPIYRSDFQRSHPLPDGFHRAAGACHCPVLHLLTTVSPTPTIYCTL